MTNLYRAYKEFGACHVRNSDGYRKKLFAEKLSILTKLGGKLEKFRRKFKSIEKSLLL